MRMSTRERRPSSSLIAAMLALSLTGGLAAAAQAAPTWQTVSYGRVQFRVPAEWPIVDMAAHPTACMRLDVSAVYLGRQGEHPDCPAVVVGRTNAVYVEPLDARSVGVVNFAETPA